MKLNPKDATLNKLALISLIFGTLFTTLLILTGSDKRAEMDAAVAKRGHGYNGDFQIINSIGAGIIYGFGFFVVITTIVYIWKSKNNQKV